MPAQITPANILTLPQKIDSQTLFLAKNPLSRKIHHTPIGHKIRKLTPSKPLNIVTSPSNPKLTPPYYTKQNKTPN
jgi:hypothetical protein